MGSKMRWGGLLIQRDKVKDKIDAGINKKYIKWSFDRSFDQMTVSNSLTNIISASYDVNNRKSHLVIRSFDMLCTKNFLIARTYLINYIYIGNFDKGCK